MKFRVLFLFVAAAAGALSVAQDESGPKPGWVITPSLDFYFGAASPNPGSGSNRVGRQFDTRNNQVRIATAQVALTYFDKKSGFGLSLTPRTGDNSDVFLGADTSTNWLAHYFAEAYASYYTRDGKTSFDFGRWSSFVGYEGNDSIDGEVYGRSLIGSTAQPNFHTGLRINHQVDRKLGLSLYATNGWNQTERKTQGLSYGGQFRYSLDDKSQVIGSILTGREGEWNETNGSGAFGGIGFVQPGVSEVTATDLTITHNFRERANVALDLSYTTSKNAPNNGTFYGFELIGRYLLARQWNLGARIGSLADGGGIFFGQPSTIEEATLGLDYLVDKESTIRLELRADRSNTNIFNDSNGGLTDHQTTLNFAYYFRF